VDLFGLVGGERVIELGITKPVEWVLKRDTESVRLDPRFESVIVQCHWVSDGCTVDELVRLELREVFVRPALRDASSMSEFVPAQLSIGVIQ
jgi:hypothetical protein